MNPRYALMVAAFGLSKEQPFPDVLLAVDGKKRPHRSNRSVSGYQETKGVNNVANPVINAAPA